jgi:hypothetical protein
LTSAARTSQRSVDILVDALDEDRRNRLVKLLAVGLERHLRANGGVLDASLTPSPTLCLYTAHGDDGEETGE